MTRRLFTTSIATAAVAVSRSRQEPSFPNWSEDFVDRMLTDSPWARPLTIAFHLQANTSPFLPRPRTAAPSGKSRGNGPRSEFYLITRWASALPVRQAAVLHQYGLSGLEREDAVEQLKTEPTEYVIEIAGFPTILFRKGAQALEDSLAGSARISVPGRAPLAPASVRVPEHGMHLMATLRFPRYESLAPEEGSLAFSTLAGPHEIEQGFKLKTMVYGSRLEL